jgi:hypothetical protein
MSRGVYSVHASIAAVTTAKTLLQIKAGASTPLEILRAWCTNGDVTADDQMEIQLIRKSAAATVTSFTPILFDPSDQAAKAVGGTSATGYNASAEGTDGDIVWREAASVLAGWIYLPTPDERAMVAPGGIIAMKSNITVASMTMICGIIFRELA